MNNVFQTKSATIEPAVLFRLMTQMPMMANHCQTPNSTMSSLRRWVTRQMSWRPYPPRHLPCSLTGRVIDRRVQKTNYPERVLMMVMLLMAVAMLYRVLAMRWRQKTVGLFPELPQEPAEE
jgi:hypothetical protein